MRYHYSTALGRYKPRRRPSILLWELQIPLSIPSRKEEQTWWAAHKARGWRRKSFREGTQGQGKWLHRTFPPTLPAFLYGFDVCWDLVFDVMHNLPPNVVKHHLKWFADLELVQHADLEKQRKRMPWTPGIFCSMHAIMIIHTRNSYSILWAPTYLRIATCHICTFNCTMILFPISAYYTPQNRKWAPTNRSHKPLRVLES